MNIGSEGRTPILLLGGQENSLSVLRSLVRHGVPVRLSAGAHCYALQSRYCVARYVVPDGVESTAFWNDLLLGGGHPELRGSVVFACSDDAIEFMATRRGELAQEYLLDDHMAAQQLALLDKQATLKIARDLGIPAPAFWRVEEPGDIDAFEGELDFPVLIKPIHSHKFQAVFRQKLLLINDRAELRSGVHEAVGHGLAVTVCELIPGPDSLLSSYYTYIDEEDNHLFHFTKRVIRRSPADFGAGCYHMTEWLPETAELGERFFRGMGFRGLGNIEFKRDLRDGQLKVIECNARFTAAQELLVRSGMDIAWIIYCHITGETPPPVQRFTEHMSLLYLLDDFDGFRDLRARGDLSFFSWLRSIARPQVFPYLALRDPMPALARGRDTFQRRVLSRLRS